MEYILYCDESSSDGPKYSDFFGGCIINSVDLKNVENALNAKKDELNLHGEIKWTKVTAQYLEKYIAMVDLFFDFIRDGKVKVRIMFRNNEDRPSNYHDRHSNDDKYFKLYYQFLKNAFGLKNIPAELGDVYIRVYLDQLPDTKEKCDAFKAFVRNLPNIRDFENVRERIHIRDGDVVDVCSHKHILLQCTDIVLGAMYFRLNDLHLEKPENSRTRGNVQLQKKSCTSTLTPESVSCFRALTLVCQRGIEATRILNGSCRINIGSLYLDKRNVPPSLHQYPTYKRKASGKAGRFQHSICRKNK